MKRADVIKSAPKVIYIQHDVDETGEPFPTDNQGDEVTWCKDRVSKTDIKYVRADLARKR